MQHVLVCTDDPVLAKRVRFLLARDQCEVSIMDGPAQLESTLKDSPPDLLILSRELHGEDHAQWMSRTGAPTVPTVVLGGESSPDAPHIRAVEDPSDPQAIFSVASEILASSSSGGGGNGSPPRASFSPPPEQATEQAPRPTIESAPNKAPANLAKPKAAQPASASRDRQTSGDLDATPGRLAKQYHDCARNQLTGHLVLTESDETLTLQFDKGRAVNLRSSRPGDRFGRWLVEQGELGEGQYADAAKRVVEMGVGLGQALVQGGHLSEDDLAALRGDHARTLIIARFREGPGKYRFEPDLSPTQRTFEVDVLPVVASGFKQHASEETVRDILMDRDKGYFEVRSSPEGLRTTFALSPAEEEFLRFGGRAYNAADGAELAGIPLTDALKLLALLWTCSELEQFTPGVSEFEDRIEEEKQRARESQLSGMSAAPPIPEGDEADEPALASLVDDEPPPLAMEDMDEPALEAEVEHQEAEPIEAIGSIDDMGRGPPPPPEPTPFPLELQDVVDDAPPASPFAGPAPVSASQAPPLPSSSPEAAVPASGPASPVSSPASQPSAPPTTDSTGGGRAPAGDIPAMPVPKPGHEGLDPAPMTWATPLPRSPDGTLLDTPEHQSSKGHFQQGVQLLGQGKFAAAENAFRDAVALCSEEHVYLVGLARAIFYNGTYRADGKLPVLREIVSRAESMAPKDSRVTTLRAWVEKAVPTAV